MEQETIDQLRKQLEDYYGTAMQEFPMAVLDLSDIEQMTDEEVIDEAKRLGWL